MKLQLHLLAVFVTIVGTALGNFYVPNAKLAGETVCVRLTKDAALITAAFEFDDWATRDGKLVYFPIFSDNPLAPVQILARAEFELEVAGQKLGVASPCEAPKNVRTVPKNPQACWFSANLDDLIADTDLDINSRIVIKVSYSQPLIRGRFYYLPVIVGHTDDARQSNRAWRYQMFVRSASRVPQVLSKETDFEQFGDSIVVYLKHSEIVEIN